MKETTKHHALINGSITEGSLLFQCTAISDTGDASRLAHHIIASTLSMGGGLGAGEGDATTRNVTNTRANTSITGANICPDTDIKLRCARSIFAPNVTGGDWSSIRVQN